MIKKSEVIAVTIYLSIYVICVAALVKNCPYL